MIKLEESEVWAFNILNKNAQMVQEELRRCGTAQQAYIKLLETKYNATFDPKTGQFEPIPEKPRKD